MFSCSVISKLFCQIISLDPGLNILGEWFLICIILFFIKKMWMYYYFLCIWMFWLHVWIYNKSVPVNFGGQRSPLDTLELELQMVMDCMQMLGAETRSSERTLTPETSLEDIIFTHFILLSIKCLFKPDGDGACFHFST